MTGMKPTCARWRQSGCGGSSEKNFEGQEKQWDEFLAFVRKSMHELQESMAKEMIELFPSGDSDSENMDSDCPDSVSEAAAAATKATSPDKPSTAPEDKALAAQPLTEDIVTTKVSLHSAML